MQIILTKGNEKNDYPDKAEFTFVNRLTGKPVLRLPMRTMLLRKLIKMR
jgi:hypothetical protein